MPTCDAALRNKQALHQLELGWGAGTFDYGLIKRILEKGCEDHQHEEGQCAA